MLRALELRGFRPQPFRKSSPLRSVSTRPGLIPNFANTWDPTTRRPAKRRPSAPQQTKDEPVQNAVEERARRAIRKKLCDKQQFVISQDGQHLPPRIRALNRYLSLVHASGCDDSVRPKLWRLYKSLDPGFIQRIPDRAWEILWVTQSVRSEHNKNRVRHLQILYKDMKAAGKKPTLGQRLDYLQHMFYNGQKERALQEWEDDYTQVVSNLRQDYKPEHMELGVVMHALADDPDRSLEIMNELFKLYPDRNPKIMVAVFRAHVRSKAGRYHQTARTLYSRFRDVVGNKTILEAYDGWLVGFLENRDLQQAKAVFRDMITSGNIAHSNSRVVINQTLRRLHLLYRLGTNIEKMTSVALFALSVLPKEYHRHVFGYLMKATVIKEAPEAGAQVLEMIFRRGLKPDTFHFNLLLKCLFRTKDTERVLKAENIGWQMVDKARRSGAWPMHSDSRNAADAISSAAKGATLQPSAMHDIAEHIPPANVTTYALLMEHHSRQFHWEHMDYLARRMKDSDIQPNSAVMAEVMISQCRRGKYENVWNVYQSLTNPPEGKKGVFPDGKVMRCLWLSLRLARNDHDMSEKLAGLPTPRTLLKETVEWWDLVKSRYDAERFKTGFSTLDHGTISALIMHCFSYSKDLPGSLVAMHVLRQRLGIFPSHRAIEILQRHVARADLQRETEAVRVDYARSGRHKAFNKNMDYIYRILKRRRLKRMGLTRRTYAKLKRTKSLDLRINTLSELVRTALKRQHQPEDVEAMIDAVKEQIGLPELETGDMTAFEIA